MSAKKTQGVDQGLLKVYTKLLDEFPQIGLKGATMPYTSHNGHMFSFIDKTGNLNLRLPTDLREEFLKKFKASPTEAHGVTLKEYVTIPEKLLTDSVTLKKYFKESFHYVEGLKPKNKKQIHA